MDIIIDFSITHCLIKAQHTYLLHICDIIKDVKWKISFLKYPKNIGATKQAYILHYKIL